MATVLIAIAALFFLGHALNWFFSVSKIPDLLVLVALGYVLGPLLGVLNPEDFGKAGSVITTIALVVILYEGGLHLDAKELLNSSLPALGLTSVAFVAIVAAATLIGMTLGLQSFQISLLFGISIGSTSSAIVIPMVRQLPMSERMKTILSLESAFTDVLVIVLVLVVVESLMSSSVGASDVLISLGPKTLIALALGALSGLIWSLIKAQAPGLVPKAFAGEAWALLTYGAIEVMGFNGALAVLALGFMLANIALVSSPLNGLLGQRPLRSRELTLLGEITFLLRTFFFVYLGLFITFSSVNTVLVAIAATLVMFITRYFSVRLLFKPSAGYSRLDAMAATAMGPRGLACAVVATIPLQNGIAGGEWIRDAVFAIVPITIFLTAVFQALSTRAKIRANSSRLFGAYSES